MSSFDYPEKPAGKTNSGKGGSKKQLWNILTLVMLLFTFCMCGYFLIVFINPYSALNPLMPSTPVQPLVLPSPTWTPIALEPTWTPTATLPPTATNTPRPTFTPIPTNTPFVLASPTPTGPTSTPTTAPSETPTVKPTGVPFTSEVKYVESAIIHPEAACAWIGVGGTVVDQKGNPVKGMIVKLTGSIDGSVSIPKITVSGTAPAYGPSGYEFALGTVPLDSKGKLTIQLFDQGGLPLSEPIVFDTFSDCKKNLALIRFKQVK